ncbi:glycosyltransferase family 2 protein [Candidatus Magnetominusculus dajiuhuensis]|uniref:glycosyltransferase family 2 protein n=1 Tax=Candidatus Magnetominusculus dajiuhuensis TaxID=3137712 RepID=UPI003B428B0E
MDKMLIIIPAFNEEKSIGAVIAKIRHAPIEADILVVSDGSTDNTAAISSRLGAHVINHAFNLGYGGALQSGFRFALNKNYDMVITMDADGQHDPSYIKNLLEAKVRDGANIVIGTRFIDSDYNAGFFKRAVISMFSTIIRLYTGRTITDPTSGFQLMDKAVLSYLSHGDNFPLDYPDANMIMLLHKKKFRISETPVKMFNRLDGISMHSGIRPLIYMIRMLLAIVMVMLRRD